jgi:hypothetical protein
MDTGQQPAACHTSRTGQTRPSEAPRPCNCHTPCVIGCTAQMSYSIGVLQGKPNSANHQGADASASFCAGAAKQKHKGLQGTVKHKAFRGRSTKPLSVTVTHLVCWVRCNMWQGWPAQQSQSPPPAQQQTIARAQRVIQTACMPAYTAHHTALTHKHTTPCSRACGAPNTAHMAQNNTTPYSETLCTRTPLQPPNRFQNATDGI